MKSSRTIIRASLTWKEARVFADEQHLSKDTVKNEKCLIIILTLNRSYVLALDGGARFSSEVTRKQISGILSVRTTETAIYIPMAGGIATSLSLGFPRSVLSFSLGHSLSMYICICIRIYIYIYIYISLSCSFTYVSGYGHFQPCHFNYHTFSGLI
jgi:hypothetical protein